MSYFVHDDMIQHGHVIPPRKLALGVLVIYELHSYDTKRRYGLTSGDSGTLIVSHNLYTQRISSYMADLQDGIVGVTNLTGHT